MSNVKKIHPPPSFGTSNVFFDSAQPLSLLCSENSFQSEILYTGIPVGTYD